MKEKRTDCEKSLLMEDTAPEKIRHLQKCSSCRNFDAESCKYMDMVRKENLEELEKMDFDRLDSRILSHAAFTGAERRRRKVLFRRIAEIAACIAVIFTGSFYFYSNTGASAGNQGYAKRMEQNNIELKKGNFSAGDEFDLMENMDTLAGEVIYLSTQLDAVVYDAALASYQS